MCKESCQGRNSWVQNEDDAFHGRTEGREETWGRNLQDGRRFPIDAASSSGVLRVLTDNVSAGAGNTTEPIFFEKLQKKLSGSRRRINFAQHPRDQTGTTEMSSGEKQLHGPLEVGECKGILYQVLAPRLLVKHAEG